MCRRIASAAARSLRIGVARDQQPGRQPAVVDAGQERLDRVAAVGEVQQLLAGVRVVPVVELPGPARAARARRRLAMVCCIRWYASSELIRPVSRATTVLHRYAPMLVGEVYAARLAGSQAAAPTLSAGSPVVGVDHRGHDFQVSATQVAAGGPRCRDCGAADEAAVVGAAAGTAAPCWSAPRQRSRRDQCGGGGHGGRPDVRAGPSGQAQSSLSSSAGSVREGRRRLT